MPIDPANNDALPRRYRITVDDFIVLDDAGAFDETGRVELIDGELLHLIPRDVPHGRTLAILATCLGLPLRAMADFEALMPMSAHLDRHNMPEVDLIVARAVEGPFVTPASAQLFVEVATASLAYDLERKLPLYARFGVPEYWVADVKSRRMVRFHMPVGEKYAERAEFAFGDTITSAAIAGLTVDTARLA